MYGIVLKDQEERKAKKKAHQEKVKSNLKKAGKVAIVATSPITIPLLVSAAIVGFFIPGSPGGLCINGLSKVVTTVKEVHKNGLKG